MRVSNYLFVTSLCICLNFSLEFALTLDLRLVPKTCEDCLSESRY